VAVGKITLIAGEPGLGKSQVALYVASAVSTGGTWPDRHDPAPRGRVIILSAEDGLGDTIRPRVDAAGGDPSRITVIRAVETKADGGVTRASFNLAADLALLEQEIKRCGDVRLVVIDPVSSYMGKVDSHKNADVRGVLEPIGEMAERLRVAVLAITHLNKGDGKAINRFIGSIAFIAAARAAFTVVKDPDDETGTRRLFLQVKNNIAASQPGLALRLEQREIAPGIIGSSVAWDDSAPVTMTADQALNSGGQKAEQTAKDDAVEFLRELLADGAIDVLDIEAEARASAMLAENRRLKESKPFRDAAKALRVVRKRAGFGPGARMSWALPDAPTTP
jgi:RecA-family ATPase